MKARGVLWLQSYLSTLSSFNWTSYKYRPPGEEEGEEDRPEAGGEEVEGDTGPAQEEPQLPEAAEGGRGDDGVPGGLDALRYEGQEDVQEDAGQQAS